MNAEREETAHEKRVREGRRGGLKSSSNMTPEERSERGRKGAEGRWAKENARRAEQGLPLRGPKPPALSAAELEPWLAEVDRCWPDASGWSDSVRERQAFLLAKAAASGIADHTA